MFPSYYIAGMFCAWKYICVRLINVSLIRHQSDIVNIQVNLLL